MDRGIKGEKDKGMNEVRDRWVKGRIGERGERSEG